MTAICSELRIDKEFAGLCPKLTPEEINLLESSLMTEGCRDPIILWANHDDTILDGHNRYRICARFKIPFKTKALKFDERHDALNWIIANQLGRRNLTEDQKKFLRGKRYVAEKMTMAEAGAEKGKSLGQNDSRSTADRLAKEYGISAPTIKRDAKFAEAVDKIEETLGTEAKQEILSGKCKLGSAAIVEAAELPPKKMAKALETGKLPVQDCVSYAMRYADMAIQQLKRITDDDPECDAAIDKVIDWLKKRRAK